MSNNIAENSFPLPSGYFSIKQAWLLSILTGILASFCVFAVLTFPTNITFIIGMSLTTIIYSEPSFRVRRSAWIPKFINISIRGALFPLVCYIGACEIAEIGSGSLEHLIFILIFAVLFCVGMDTFEDIPDLEGDRLHGYASLAQKIGPVPTAYISLVAFSLAYASLSLWVLSSPQLFSVSLRVVASIVFLALFCLRFRRLLNELPNNVMAAKPFYRFLWQLYCAQYLLLPILFKYP